MIALNLTLYFRNRMGLFYGCLFPAIFLAAFLILYRADPVPLIRHMAELLTVTALGGACLGMPTTIVSEREKGVWRRYRLTPVSTAHMVISMMLARYLILITAAALQLVLALAAGMPIPPHLFGLWIAFTFVAFAMLGLGLVIASLADNVPAVQALGQCIFLPMLIIGGIAVPATSLPDWAQHLAAFFPGRYAVEAMRACIRGDGLQTAAFDLIALTLVGISGCIAGAKLFRWDAQQRFTARTGKAWLLVALASWLAVGAISETKGRIEPKPITAPAKTEPPAAAIESHEAVTKTVRRARPNEPEQTWQQVTLEEIENRVVFDHLPVDTGIVNPVAAPTDEPSPDILAQLNEIKQALPNWPPGHTPDPIQRTRNLLYIAAAPDVAQMEELERFLPLLVFDRLKQEFPPDDLPKILYWLATHPGDGNLTALQQLQQLGLGEAPRDTATTRDRTALYAIKLLGRLLGKLPAK